MVMRELAPQPAAGFGRRRRRAGFSMLEVTLSTLLVGVLLTVSMSTAGVLIRRHGLRAQADVKMALAHDLLGEMEQVFFTDPDRTQSDLGPEFGETGEGRRRFDDIDDYDGWQAAVVQDKNGAPLVGFEGYRRSVEVRYVRLSDPAEVNAVATDLKRIVVTVTGPDGQAIRLTALRSRRGGADQMPGVRATFVRSVQMELSDSKASHPVRSGVGLLNQVTVEDDS